MPIIGIVPNMTNDIYKVNELYINSLSENFSDFSTTETITPIIFPYTKNSINEYMNLIDGVLLTGGGDISAKYLTEPLNEKSNSINENRDAFEIEICKYAIKHNIPILGICRGMQVLNISANGSINQHIENHDQTQRGLERNSPSHAVRLYENSRLYKIYNTQTLNVNSIHHQSVNNLGENFKISGVSQDGITEAIEHKINNFCIGVQWHPELLDDNKIFNKFIESTIIYNKNRCG